MQGDAYVPAAACGSPGAARPGAVVVRTKIRQHLSQPFRARVRRLLLIYNRGGGDGLSIEMICIFFLKKNVEEMLYSLGKDFLEVSSAGRPHGLAKSFEWAQAPPLRGPSS